MLKYKQEYLYSYLWKDIISLLLTSSGYLL